MATEIHESERGLFTLNGITGMLIATVLLLSILAGLTVWGLGVQNKSADQFYTITDIETLTTNSPANNGRVEVNGQVPADLK